MIEVPRSRLIVSITGLYRVMVWPHTLLRSVISCCSIILYTCDIYLTTCWHHYSEYRIRNTTR